MKQLTRYLVYSILILGLNIQCDSIPLTTSDSDSLTAPELIIPKNNSIITSQKAELVWVTIKEAESYQLMLSDDNDSTSTTLVDTTVSEIPYITPPLAEQTTYSWKVKPIKGDKPGRWSDTWKFTTSPEDSTSTNTVQLISPLDEADKVSTESEFSWQPISGISDFSYQLSDNSSFNSVIVEDQVTGTTYSPSVLTHQKKYYWRVRVADDESGETWSGTRSFTTGQPDDESGNPEKVTLLNPENGAINSTVDPVFEWTEVSGASSYEFQLSVNSTFSILETEANVIGTTHEARNLNYETQYFWRVRVNAANQEWSDTGSFTTRAATIISPPPSSSFVQVHNSNFVKNDEIIRFAGTNAYYLPNYEKINPAVVDQALNLFQETGITVIRMWGFYDGYDCGYSKNDANENVIQTAPGVYSESALKDLDKVIAKGKERGIGFIVPFINFWDELGGVCQYNTWAGASDPSTNMEFFLNNSNTQKWYKDYISMLLNRVNTVTGVAYKDEPAIVAWQIMNEGRNPGASATILRNWYKDMAQYIKSIDPNHLVSTGEEGFDEGTPSEYSVNEYSNTYTLRADIGSSYVLNTAIPEIDFGNAHWYPSEYGFGINMTEDLLRAQRAWLSDHKKIAETSGKPFMIGEYGFPGWADERVNTMYDALYVHAESIQLDGNLLWQLTADGTKCWEFGGNICYPGGREDVALYNDFKNHVSILKNL